MHTLLATQHLDKHTGRCFVNANLDGFSIQEKNLRNKHQTSHLTYWLGILTPLEPEGHGVERIMSSCFWQRTSSASPGVFCYSDTY